MKARRAIVDHAVLGSAYVVAGVVALVVASTRAEREFGLFAAALAVFLLGATVFVVAMAAHGLRRIEALPEEATLLRWHSVAIRGALTAAVPVGTIIYVSTAPTGQGWILGLGCAVLGAAICGSAVLASHTERRCGTRIFRIDNRYFFVRSPAA